MIYRFLLKQYLRFNKVLFDRVMYHLAPRCFGGNHPKNIFHFRSEFFAENSNKSDVILDIACGQGTILKKIAATIQQGVGVDQNTKMLALAKRDAPVNLKFIEGDIFGKAVQDILEKEQVTKVILSHILEHLPDPIAFMRTLKSRELLICVPSEENWYRQLLMNLGIPHLSDPTHFREYTRASLKEHLSGAGYNTTFIGFNSEGEIICRAKSTTSVM